MGCEVEADDDEDEVKSEAWLNAEARVVGGLDVAAEERNRFLLLRVGE